MIPISFRCCRETSFKRILPLKSNNRAWDFSWYDMQFRQRSKKTFLFVFFRRSRFKRFKKKLKKKLKVRRQNRCGHSPAILSQQPTWRPKWPVQQERNHFQNKLYLPIPFYFYHTFNQNKLYLPIHFYLFFLINKNSFSELYLPSSLFTSTLIMLLFRRTLSTYSLLLIDFNQQ